MARVLEEFPGRRSKHGSSWDQYLDGQIWELTLEDFPNYKDIRSLGSGFIDICHKRGLRGRTRRKPDVLVVQVLGKKGDV